MIYHITSQAEWLAAQQTGQYRADSLEKEGFIHCSTAEQILKVANAFYRGRTDLVLLFIDENQLGDKVRWEAPAGMPHEEIRADQLFPHMYGVIPLQAIQHVAPFRPDSTGSFTSLPEA